MSRSDFAAVHVYSTDDLASLADAVKAMRDLGVTRWRDIELGPDPRYAAAEEETQREPTVYEREKERRAQRDRLASLHSGGPRPAVGRPQ